MPRSLVCLFLIVGCGDDGVVTFVDAPDVPPDTVDASTYNFSCLGVPFGTTAPEPTSVIGKVVDVTDVGLSAIVVDVRDAADDTVLASAVTGGDGSYQTSVATGGEALDIYRRLTGTGIVTTRAVTNGPLTGTSNLTNVVLTTVALANIETGFGVTHDPSTGIVAMAIRDCDDAPIAGAQIAVSPAPTRIGYFDDSLPAAAATATAGDGFVMAFGLAPGAVAVTVTIGDVTFRARALAVEANGITLSFRQP